MKLDLRPMLRMIFLWIFFLNASAGFAQTIGDYRTSLDFDFAEEQGYWSDLAMWHRYNGTTWAEPTAMEGYPGENAVPAVVTLNAGTRVQLDRAVNLGSLYSNGEFSTEYSGVDLIIDVELETGSNSYFAFLSEDGDLIVNGTVDNSGFLSLDNIYGTTTFVGQVVNQLTGLISCTIIEDYSQLVFQGGILNLGTFTAGGATFNTNNQTISGTSPVSFANTVRLENVTVTNSNSAAVSIINTGPAVLTGTGAGTWTQGTNSTLNYSGATITNIILNASNSGNTVNYNSGFYNQTIFNPSSSTYANLILSGASIQTKTLSANTIVSGNLSILQAAIFSVNTFTLSVAGTWTNNGVFNAGTTGTVVFNGTSTVVGSATTNFNHITVSGTLTSPASLGVAGNFTNNGTFTSGTGTLLLNGSDTQSIGGSTVTTFNNITVTNVAGPPSVQVQSNQNLRGTLTLSSNSTFDADGSSGTSIFTLLSTGDSPTVDAAIASLPSGASVSGQVTVQRFMAIEGGNGGNGRIYRYISSPVQSVPVSQIQTEIPVTGTFTGSSTCSGCGATQSMFLYNESVVGSVDLGYEDFPATANTETLTAGRGYSIFVRGNIAPVSTAGNARWDVRGVIHSGEVVFNSFVTRSGATSDDGWNMVGNPYPSTIDWDAAGWTKTGINNAIYMRNNGLSSPVYATYIAGVGLNGGSGFIPLGQAFWVKSDAGSIDFRATETVKTGGTQTTFFREESINDLLRVSLNDGMINDESAIRFSDEATSEFDLKLDAYKFKNSTVNLCSVTEQGAKLAVNSLPQFDCTSTISLDVANVVVGWYSFDFTGFDSFESAVQFILTDTFLGQSVDVKSNPHYDFQVTGDLASFGSERFKIIVIREVEISSALSVAGDQKCDNQNLQITIDDSQNDVSYQPYYNGASVGDAVQGNGSTVVIDLHGDAFATGLYEVTVKAFNSCNELFLNQKATIQVFGIDQATIENNGNTLVSNYTSGNQWYLNGTLIPGAITQQYDATESGLYTLVVTAEQCTTSDDLQFLVTDAEEPFISSVEVYPNPFKDKFRFTIESTAPVNTRIYGALGSVVFEKLLDQQSVNKSVEFDLSGNRPGIYVLHIQKGSRIHQVKIIKSK
jgi:hypothetical protein